MSRKTLGIFLDSTPGYLRVFLAALPFILVICVYLVAAEIRHSDNPNDKLLPTYSQLKDSTYRLAFEANKRSGKILLWSDSAASLKRLVIGVSCASFCALLLGLFMGVFRKAEQSLATFVTVFSMIPPLAVLPILFIVFGLGEVGKVTLIFIGTFPLITRDIYLTVKALPQEQIVKALTLGATPLAVALKIVLPQITPRLLQSIRLSLGAAWLFLIAAEAIAATDGLGYRIFLVRRYMSMEIIVPYVLWITFLGFSMDYALRLLIRQRYNWYLAK